MKSKRQDLDYLNPNPMVEDGQYMVCTLTPALRDNLRNGEFIDHCVRAKLDYLIGEDNRAYFLTKTLGELRLHYKHFFGSSF